MSLKAEFEKWCRDERASLASILARMEKGEMRMHAGSPGGQMHDISEETMARHRSSLAELDSIIAKIEAEKI